MVWGRKMTEEACWENLQTITKWLYATLNIFKQPKRRIWTWQSPRSERYQLDYITIKSRYRNTVRNCHSYPGADVNSDYNLVSANLKQVRYKKIKGARKRLKWNLSTLANEEIKLRNIYVNEVENAVNTGDDMLGHLHLIVRS